MASRLPRRNVEVYDPDSVVILVNHFVVSFFLTKRAGFWQYGTLQWDEFYRYLTTFVVTNAAWATFQYDSEKHQHGEQCPSGSQVVQPGKYILLSDSE